MDKHVFITHFVNLCQNIDFRTKDSSVFCAECLKTSFGYDIACILQQTLWLHA